SGEPVPVETSTPSPVASQGGQYLGFDTEEEAIAAAEEVYEKYLLSLDSAAPDEEPRPTDYLTGAAYEAAIASQAEFESRGLRIDGAPVSEILDKSYAQHGEVKLTTCEQITARILNADGVDVTPKDRPATQALEVTLELDPQGELRISDSKAIRDDRC